jgi:hypothetical protein
MHVSVTIGDILLRSLLSFGSTRNFIDTVAVEHVGVRFTCGAGLRMAVANGDHITSSGFYSTLDINIASECFISPSTGLHLAPLTWSWLCSGQSPSAWSCGTLDVTPLRT